MKTDAGQYLPVSCAVLFVVKGTVSPIEVSLRIVQKQISIDGNVKIIVKF